MEIQKKEKLEAPESPETVNGQERKTVIGKVTELVDELGERCPECGTEITLEAIRDYCQNCLSQRETNVPTPGFELSEPESRLYKPDEKYAFLVHISLGNLDQRMEEIGSERGGVLMATLMNAKRQGTFCGEGGLILSAPVAESIRGISSVDCGGEIADGRMDSIEKISGPASNADYNQIDMKFDGTRVVGVMIKVTPDGKELGSPKRNAQLREIAERQGLPVALVEITPSPMPTELSTSFVEISDGNTLSTFDIPNGEDHFLRVNIAQGNFYHSPGLDTISRSMAIDQFGQVDYLLTAEQEQKIRTTLAELHKKGQITEKDMTVALEEILPRTE